jgi:hypothetical protein
MPHASLYVSPRGSHDWMIDHAPEFAAALRAFVDATRQSIVSTDVRERGVFPLSPVPRG